MLWLIVLAATRASFLERARALSREEWLVLAPKPCACVLQRQRLPNPLNSVHGDTSMPGVASTG